MFDEPTRDVWFVFQAHSVGLRDANLQSYLFLGFFYSGTVFVCDIFELTTTFVCVFSRPISFSLQQVFFARHTQEPTWLRLQTVTEGKKTSRRGPVVSLIVIVGLCWNKFFSLLKSDAQSSKSDMIKFDAQSSKSYMIKFDTLSSKSYLIKFAPEVPHIVPSKTDTGGHQLRSSCKIGLLKRLS